MDLKAFRSQYPQYDSIPDQKLVDGLHNKFYSQLPKDEFYNRIGFAPAVAEAEAPVVAPEAPVAAPEAAAVTQEEPATAAAPVVAREEPAVAPVVAQEEPTAAELEAASRPAFNYRNPIRPESRTVNPDAVNMPGSVMHGTVPPSMELPTTSKAPVRPEFRAAFNAQWDAATPEQREALQGKEGVIGQLARERAGIFERQAELTAGTPTDSALRSVDPRIEARRAELIAKGEAPEFADTVARLGAERGVLPGGEIAAAGTVQPSEFDFETNRFFNEQAGVANPLVRGTAKAVLGTGKAIFGINEFFADLTGAEEYSKFLKKGTKTLRGKEEAIGEKGAFLERNLEGAISSIGQQLPWMVAGVATGGGSTLPLIGMGLQSFGQEYTDGRAQKQTIQQAATRASVMAAFEVLGEKFGLSDQLKALRGAAKGMENDQIIKLLASALKKEVPSELFTTSGQFAADKWMPQGYALNPDATVEDFVKQVANTIAQTVMQSGVMGAGTTGVSTARRFLSERGYGEGVAAADAENARTAALQKAAGMFKPVKPRAEVSEETAPDEAVPTEAVVEAGRAEPTFTVDPETGEVIAAPAAQPDQNSVIEQRALELRQANGYPAEIALAVARREFAEGDLDAKRPPAESDTGRTEPSISVPEQGAAATEGVAPSGTTGLAGPVEDIDSSIARAEAELDTLGEVTTLTERPPAAEVVEPEAPAEPEVPARTPFAELPKDEKASVMDTAKSLYQSREITLPIEKSWDNLPEWKHELFAERLYEGGEDFANDPDQVYKARVEIAGLENKPAAAETPVAETPAAPIEQAQTKLAEAETAVAEATTPEEKQEATKQRNVARQELKKAQAETPAAETPAQAEASVPPIKPSVQRWFGKSKAVDSKGKPLVLYRGLVGGEVDPFSGRAGYAIFTSDNPYIASSYAGDPTAEFGNAGGVVYPMYAKVDNVIEFPLDRNGSLDKFEFDKRAKTLKPGEALVARNVMDTGPRMTSAMAEGYTKKSGDIWAFANGTKFQSAISPATPKRGRPAKPKVEGAEPATPKKRGRPAKLAELTPEERAFKEAERQQNQEDLIKAARGVNKTIKIVEAAPQETKYKTPEEFEMAKVAAASARKTALYRLHQYATSPAFRSAKASGIKAAQYLASDAVTPKERADLQARIEFEKTRPPAPSAARKKTTEKADPAYAKFKTATQAIDHIMRNGTPFERILAARLKPFVSDVRLVVADTQENTPDAIKALLTDASGVYSSARYGDKVYRMIVLRGENFDDPAMQGMNNTIFLHEALHGATEAKIDEYLELVAADMEVPAPLQAVMNDLMGTMVAAQDQYKKLVASGKPIPPNLRHKFAKLDITNDLKEFVAYGLTDPDVQQFLLETPGAARKDQALGYLKNLFTGFVNSIRRAFNMDAKHQSALQDLMLATEGILREQELEPAQSVNTVLNAKQEKVDKNLEKIKLSPDSNGMVDPIEENVKDGHTYNDFNDLLQSRLDAMGNGFITKTLATLQTADIVRWQGDAIPALKSIDNLVEKMAGSRMNMERAFTKKADKFAQFIRKVGSKKQLLANAMHLARLNSVSPSLFTDRADALVTDKRMAQLDKLLADPTTPQEELPAITRKRTIREKQINQTFDAWERLGTLKGGQDMYRMVRQFYKDANVLTRTLLDERIERLNVEGSIDDPSTPKGKLMLAVRRMQEDSDFKGIDEYFPFMRYGNFWLRVNGPQGKEFYLFENGTERNVFQKKRARQLGIDPNAESETFDAGDDLTALRTKYSPESRMLADMFETIDNEMDKPGVDKDALKDALYQTYLMTLPEESYRKQFLHAENVTGFSSDVFRNFTTSATRIASQSAKLAYGDRISAELQRARDTLTGMPISKKTKLELFVNEMGKRVEDELNPKPESKAVARINQFAYYSLLTGVASAITQTSAIPMLVMPVLNQQYGYGSSAVKLAKYMALWQSVGVTQEGADGEVVYVAPTMGESSLVKSNPILQRAFQEAIDRGLTTQTNSSVLTNRNRTPDSAYANLPRAALRTTATAMSSLFTGAERMTREMAYLMTFELEYAKNKDFDASVQKAVDTVQELLGRYDAFNRPRVMRGPLGRMVGQFKMYAVNMTSFFVRNGYSMFAEAFKGNPKEAVAAMHRLTGVLAMAAVFGGVTAFPMYSLVTSVIDILLDAFGDEEEKERRIAENPYTAFSSDLRFRYEFLPQMFGDIKITGLDGKPRTLAAVLEKGAVSELGDFNIGSRTTYDGMWFRDAKPGNTPTETIINYLVANLGPAVSSGLSMTGAIDDFSNGKIARGLERISPALFKNFFTAARLSGEGAKTPGGDVVMSKEEFSSFNIAMQSLGFQSTQLARFQENKYKLQQETIAASKTRSDILKKLDNAILDSDASDKDLDRVFDRIDKFNDRYMAMKHLRIDNDTIKRVLDRAKGKEKLMFRGMHIRKEDLPYLLELRDATERPQ